MQDIQAICVYCGASGAVRDVFKNAARELGEKIAERHIELVFGGGVVGLMGIVADAAMNEGGDVVGYMPHHLREFEAPNMNITELHLVDSMHTRKRMMFERSDAFFVLPGGFGTLDEVFEVITWRQIGLHEKPVVFLNIDGYWDPLRDLTENLIQEKFAKDMHRNFYRFVDTVDEAFECLRECKEPQITPLVDWV